MSTKSFAIILIFSIVHLTAADLAKFDRIEKCISSNLSLIIDRCDVVDGKLNFIYTILKSVTDIKIRFEFARKVGDNDYRQIFKMPEIEWCSMINGLTKIKNSMVKTLLKAIKASGKDIFVPCPHTGTRQFLNVSVEKNIISWLPSGSYKFTCIVWNNEDRNMLKVVIHSSIEK